jgi:hypothetical protein
MTKLLVVQLGHGGGIVWGTSCNGKVKVKVKLSGGFDSIGGARTC